MYTSTVVHCSTLYYGSTQLQAEPPALAAAPLPLAASRGSRSPVPGSSGLDPDEWIQT